MLGNSHHIHLQTFSLSQANPVSPFIEFLLVLPPPASPGNHHSASSLCECACSRHLLSVESYPSGPSVADLFPSEPCVFKVRLHVSRLWHVSESYSLTVSSQDQVHMLVLPPTEAMLPCNGSMGTHNARDSDYLKGNAKCLFPDCRR